MLTTLIAVYLTGLVITFTVLFFSLGKIFPRTWKWYVCLGFAAIWFLFCPYALLKDNGQ